MKFPFWLVALFCVLSSFQQVVSAQGEKLVGNVRVLSVEGGTATLVDAVGRKSQLQPGTFLRQGSKVLTSAGTTVVLLFQNGSSVSIQPESEFSLDEFVVDPFATDSLNFQKIQNEPSNSVTKISVPEGEIIFEVAKLKKGSSFEINTPVGTAGIRGTAGRAGNGGLALATGSASFTQTNGDVQPVAGGQQIGSTGAVSAAPAAVVAAITSTAEAVSNATPPNAFQGAPPNITPQQQSALNAAAASGDQALAQAAAEIAAGSPEAAADIAAVAANISPNAAATIAATVASAVPASFAAAITQSVAQQAPVQAQAIAQAVISAVPSADASAISNAAAAGASAAPSAQAATNNTNASQNSGDQGTSTAGESAGMGGGSGAPRPTPPSSP